MFIAVCLGSCENFLDGAEVKKNLNDAINYINAESCLIGVDFADGSGVLNKPAGGETEKKEGEYFSLDFDVSDKYEFIRWEIKDSVSGKTYDNGEYIGIDDVYSSDTECCFIKCPPAGVKLTLTSVTGKRPGWLSRSPEIESELSIKNMSINVTFDQEMDEESIYYNEDELKEIKGTYGPENILCTFVDGKEKYYGYKDEGGQTYFKNISISSNILKNNLAGCFKAPVFESPTVLSIAAHASQAEGDVLSNYDEILVEISDGFFYKKEGKNVALSDSIKWIYQIGNQIDSEAPLVSTCEVKGAGEVLFVPASEVPAHAKDKIPSLNFTDGTKLHFNISVADSDGTGSAANFSLMLKKLYEDDYTTQSDSKELEKKYTFPFASRQFGLIDKDVDLYNELGIKESGLYSLYFIFRDRAGYEKIWPENDEKYYFVLDMKAPDFLEPPEVEETSSLVYKITWTEPVNADYKNSALRVKNKSSGQAVITQLAKGSHSASFTAEEGVSYETDILFYDYAGNSGVQNVSILKTIDLSGTLYSPVQGVVFKKNHAHDSYEDSSADYYGLAVTACYLDDSTADVSASSYLKDDVRNTAASVTFAYTESSVTKTALYEGSYYVAGKEFLKKPYYTIDYSTDIGGTNYYYYYFGNYPQKESGKSGANMSAQTVYNGWYLGDDGVFYAEKNGIYYAVAEIEWHILKDEGDDLICFSNIIAGGIDYYGNSASDDRMLKNKTINRDNYVYSNARAYLNGIQNQYITDGGTATEYDIDWSGRGLLQSAFIPDSREYLLPLNTGVTADGRAAEDRVFLPSEEEAKLFRKNMYGKGFPSDYSGVTGNSPYPYFILRTTYDETHGKSLNTILAYSSYTFYCHESENGLKVNICSIDSKFGFAPAIRIKKLHKN